MYNKKTKNNLYKIVFIVVFLSVIVYFIGNRVTSFLNETRINNIESNLNTKADAYKLQVERQFEADIQTLYTVSSFLNVSDKENLYDILHRANKKNHFIGMLTISKDGSGIESIIDREEANYINKNELDNEMQRIFNESLNGEIVISDVFYLEDIQDKVVAISVPIFDNLEENIMGALIAYDTIDQFNTTLTISIKSDEQVDYVNMIESDGSFIARSVNRLNNNDSSSIYNMGINLLDETSLRQALSTGKDYYDLFILDNNQYAVYFKHLNYKDWYIYTINPINQTNDYMVQVLRITRITFGFIILIILFFSILSHFILRNSSKMLTKLAYYDDLTGAYNSSKFRDICEHVLKHNKDYAIIVFNISKFKFINNMYGESWANELLCYIKNVLDKNMNKNEYFCRDSSDQFFIFMKSIDKDEIVNRLNKIKRDIQGFSEIKNQNYYITIYGGICRCIGQNSSYLTYKIMLDNALFIMKEKKENKEDFIFYDESIYKKKYKQIYIENNMQESLDKNEFRLFLQPKVNNKLNKVIGAEALVRWIKDNGEVIYPNEFIPIFEENGFCEKLDLYMIEKACMKIREWIDKGIEPIQIAVNQSKLSFYKSDYIESICKITKKYNVPNSLIILEILEGLALDNVIEFNKTIVKLQKEGFQVSMDDFGSGYSSLNSLSKLKINELKIDGDFLLKMGDNEEFKNKQKTILSSVISLAKKLNLQTVIEGVEHKWHLDFIGDLEYDMAQGYYYSKPLSEKEFDEKYMNKKED